MITVLDLIHESCWVGQICVLGLLKEDVLRVTNTTRGTYSTADAELS